MTIGQICVRDVVTCQADESLIDAARRMRLFHVGAVVVVDSRSGRRVPIGILTDRDIVLSVVAGECERLPSLLVSDVMSSELVIARHGDTIAEAIAIMQGAGVRRLPVVDEAGELLGIIAADDVLKHLADEMNGLVHLVEREQRVERRQRM